MLVRHNTKLLEQAIDLQVKRSAIPMLQAEAAAHDKIARANAFRRMATGAAIAVAAVGIGVGAWFILDRDATVVAERPSVSHDERINPEKRADRIPPDLVAEDTAVKPTTPATPKLPEPQQPAAPVDPLNPDTFDFVKFAKRNVSFAGSSWELESGHHFTNEKDPIWDLAWCYTRRLASDGVEVQVSLVNRSSPTARPLAPVSSRETLALAGLDDRSALELASQCLWLDDARFGPGDFEISEERKKQAEEAQAFFVQDGWDALGNDLPGKQFRDISLSKCQDLCKGDDQCVAITYDKKHSACFMKGDASILIKEENATMAARMTVKDRLQYSTLVFATNTVVIGNSYASVQSGYADCVMACALDQRCLGFNHDGPNKMCSMLDQVNSSQVFKGVASGLKATRT